MPASTSSSRPDHLWTVVLAGGVGSRFWPVSTPTRPKQLLALAGDDALIAQTLRRIEPIVPAERTFVLTGEHLVAPIRDAVAGLTDDSFLVEPRARGTAPVLVWAAHELAKRDPDAVMASLHADHVIEPEDAFRRLIVDTAALAEETGRLFTIGIEPTRPETGYGYIRTGSGIGDSGSAFVVDQFVEKPNRETAAKYVEAGYLWNSGLFVWKVSALLDEVRAHTPELAKLLPLLDRGDVRGFFDAAPSLSIDEGLLERSDKVAVVRATFRWDDVGAWDAVARTLPADARGNVAHGGAHAVDSDGCIAWSDDRPIVLFGARDLVVVNTGALTLVMPRDRAADLKKLLEQLPPELLFDDARAREWHPFALTRPAGELRFGAFTATERLRRLAGIDVRGHLAAPHLDGFHEADGAPVIACTGIPAQPVVLLSSRAIIDWSERERLRKTIADHAHGDAVVRILVAGEPAGLVGSASLAMSICEQYTDGSIPDPGAWGDVAHEVDLKGVVLEHVWDLVSRTPEQTARDVEAEAPQSELRLPDGVHAIGSGRLVIEEGVSIEPGVVFDRAHGPIWLRAGVSVRAFSRIAGPTVVDAGTTLLGGPYDAVSIGPTCKIHGEVEETIILGYSNKAHDGFLGHAYLGRWVNLGALTTNSDLKNNYGSVRLDLGAGEVDTGITKLGCFLGDHVKTGIGMMLNTGTVVGAGSMIYGSVMPPKRVPPFVWGTGDDWVSYRFDKFVETARTVMSRRKVELDAANEEVLRRAWQDSMRGLEATA